MRVEGRAHEAVTDVLRRLPPRMQLRHHPVLEKVEGESSEGGGRHSFVCSIEARITRMGRRVARITMSGFQRMVGRRRRKASAAPSLVMTQSSLSQSMMVRSKSNTTAAPVAGAGADAIGGGWQGEEGAALFRFSGGTRLLFCAVGGGLGGAVSSGLYSQPGTHLAGR